METATRQEKPPLLYDFTSLQRDANKYYGFTAQQILDYTQSLYEKKLVTYPRTDSRYLTDDMDDSTARLCCLMKDKYGYTKMVPVSTKQVLNSSKVSDHHAIIPTENVSDADYSEIPSDEQKILGLVTARLLSSVGEPAEITEYTLEVECAGEVFKAKSKCITSPGWHLLEDWILWKKQNDEEDSGKKDDGGSHGILEILEADASLLSEGQWEMSCEIVDGIRENKHVLVEAGVGIGKSFAYIVPILYYSKIYHRPIVIATSTIALQEQLTHDIEKIMDMLNYEVEVLIAKGQNHFLCKKRFDDCFTKEFIAENVEHQIINDAICKYGYEKADWNVAIPDEIWNRINVKEYKSQFCKDKCSYCGSCHYYNLRQKMMSTHGIIVCNQDLLAVNMHKKANYRRQLMSEDIGIVVVDEAHNLESKVRSSVTSCISLKQLKDAMYGAGKAVDSFDSAFAKELENADYLIDEVFKSLLKQMNEQDKEAEKNGQDIDRYYVRSIGANFEELRNILDDIQFKASMSFGDFIGDHSRKNYDEEVEQLEDYVAFLESIIKRKNSEDIFWLERDRGSRGIKGVRLYKCPKEVDKITRRYMIDCRRKTCHSRY